jgi:hypothetical protein
MLRDACFWIVFTATVAFAQRAELPRCDIGWNSERPAASTNAVVFWNAVAHNSIVVVGGRASSACPSPSAQAKEVSSFQRFAIPRPLWAMIARKKHCAAVAESRQSELLGSVCGFDGRFSRVGRGN